MEEAVLKGLTPWISRSLVGLFLIEVVYDRDGLVTRSEYVIQFLGKYGYFPFRLNSKNGGLSPFKARKTLLLKAYSVIPFFVKGGIEEKSE